jgi:3D (Asp-Asp-Asp) domain-containing protein
MLYQKFTFLLPLLLVLLGISLQADAKKTSGEVFDMQAVTYGPAYIPYEVPITPILPVLNKQEPAASEPLHYQVNPGDTLDTIAQDFGVSVASLKTLNSLQDPQPLTSGQRLQVPAEDAAISLPIGQGKVIKRVHSFTLTAYTAGFESTGKTASSPEYGITYSGGKAEEGRTIAVDPSVIPIGTLVYIEGIGIRKAEDTGSAVRGTKIDVFMNDLRQALDFGVKQNVKVYVFSDEAAV